MTNELFSTTHVRCSMVVLKHRHMEKAGIHYLREWRMEEITIGHHSASLVIPNGDHHDGFFYYTLTTLDRRQSKTLILSTNVDTKSLETEISIVICRPTGDKCQSKNTVYSIFDPRSSIVKNVFDCHLSGVLTHTHDIFL